MPKKRATIRIIGAVQSAMYRQNTKHRADSTKILGWVRNEADGSVQIVAEGSSTDLNLFIEWCKRGSPWADIEDVIVEWGPYTGEFKGFIVY